MRISIWRQFASNHSADFAVVGTFESAEWAATVADELRAMLRAIAGWRAQFGDEDALDDAKQELFDRGLMTPPEETIKVQYGLEWVKPLDWVLSPDIAEEAIQQYESLVIVQPRGNTWSGAPPFDAILEQLGGAVAVLAENRDNDLVLRLSCVAPDEATAQRILEDVEYRDSGRDPVSPHGLFWTEARISRAGRRVTFDDLRLQHMASSRLDEPRLRRARSGQQALRDAWPQRWLGVAQQIRSLIEHLEGYGCAELEYSVRERPYT